MQNVESCGYIGIKQKAFFYYHNFLLRHKKSLVKILIASSNKQVQTPASYDTGKAATTH